jgi:hypothetical protein
MFCTKSNLSRVSQVLEKYVPASTSLKRCDIFHGVVNKKGIVDVEAFHGEVLFDY